MAEENLHNIRRLSKEGKALKCSVKLNLACLRYDQQHGFEDQTNEYRVR